MCDGRKETTVNAGGNDSMVTYSDAVCVCLCGIQVLEIEKCYAGDMSGISRKRAREVLQCELTASEFADALGLKSDSLFVDSMFTLADKDGNGYLSFQEFLDVIVIFMKGEIHNSKRPCVITLVGCKLKMPNPKPVGFIPRIHLVKNPWEFFGKRRPFQTSWNGIGSNQKSRQIGFFTVSWAS